MKNDGNDLVFQTLLCEHLMVCYQLASFWNHKSEENEWSGAK